MAGQGAEPSDPEPTPQPEPTPEQWAACGQFAATFCARLAGCAPANVERSYNDGDTCVDVEQRHCGRFVVLEGVTVDIMQEQAYTEQASCWALVEDGPLRLWLQKGALPIGSNCEIGAQCVDGACGGVVGSDCYECYEVPIFEPPHAVAGQPCIRNDSAPGFTCFDDDGDDQGIWVERPAVGEPCSLDIGCNADMCLSELCVDFVFLGDECDPLHDGCFSDLRCDPDSLRCVREDAGQPAGAMCGQAVMQPHLGWCTVGYACAPNGEGYGTCVAALGLDAACEPAQRNCAGALICEANHCVPGPLSPDPPAPAECRD